MHVQVVTFRLAGIDEASYLQHVDAVAPVFAGLPGLRAKIWLADPATATYGGVYTWADRESMDAYRGGDIFRQLQSDPHVSTLESRDFAVLTTPSTVTRGA
jgi:hypothetical protein